MAVAVLSASCVDYTGLGSDSIDYTKVGDEVVSIPAGTFTMGVDLKPKKAGVVTVNAFFMDITEVTTSAYAPSRNAAACR